MLSQTEGHNPDVLSCLANLSSDEVFTPPALANQVLDMLPEELWRDPNATFLDPACKSGVFLREIAKRLNVGLESQIPDRQERINHILKNQLFGIAITELTAFISRRTLYCSRKANGKYSVCDAFEDEQGNILYERVEHTWARDRCQYCGANQAAYERGEDLESHAYKFIHMERPEEIFNMQFDVIVSNPPYQLSDGGGGTGTSATPIYHEFVTRSKRLDPRFITMIIPSRWFAGGKGLDDFRRETLSDPRLREIHDYPDATAVFPGVQIKGGVCYFLWQRDAMGDCRVTSHNPVTGTTVMERPLLEPGADVFVRFNEAVTILHKVSKRGEETLQGNVSPRQPFGLPSTFRGELSPFPNSIVLYESGRVTHVSPAAISTNAHMIDQWKVLMPIFGSGSDAFPHPILGKPVIAPPTSACTEAYIVVGAFDSEQAAESLASYIRTRFFRFLVLLAKPSQNATARVYRFVPRQAWDRVWRDEELYKKYGLTKEEIAFIESMVRPMEPNGE